MGKRRLLLSAAAAATAAGAAAPLHASLELQEAQAHQPSRTGLADEAGKRRGRRRGRRRRLPATQESTANNMEGRAGQRSLETLAEKFIETRSLAPEAEGEGGASETVRYNPETQLPLPLDALPHIAPPSPSNSNLFDSGGPKTIPISPRIIGGLPTTPARYDYVSSLLDTSTLSHVCGGTLIAPDIVFTAGHCSGYFDSVHVGRHDIVTPAAAGTYDHLVVERHLTHPNYGNVIMNDFALAKVYGQSSVRPVRINNRRNLPRVDDALTVMGWGVTAEGISDTAAEELREVDVSTIANEVCEGAEGMYQGENVSYNGYIVENMLCAGAAAKDACQGDSGGPAIVTGASAEYDVQVGVVSWGLGCALDAFPGVYSRVSAEYAWIRQGVCEMSSDPPDYLGCDDDMPENIVDWTSDLELVEVTVAIELDDAPGDTSYVLEPDPGTAIARSSALGKVASVEGNAHVPFDTFTEGETIHTEVLRVMPNEQYRLTLIDRGLDGLRPLSFGANERPARFRLCYGAVSGLECISALPTSDVVLCSENGMFDLAKSVQCFVPIVETPAPSPPPFASVGDPLEAVQDWLPIWDDDRPETEAPTPTPTASPTTALPTKNPTAEPTIDGTLAPTKAAPTDFLSGIAGDNFWNVVEVVQSAVTDAPTPNPTLPRSNDVMDVEVQLSQSSSFRREGVAWSLAVVSAAALCFAMCVN